MYSITILNPKSSFIIHVNFEEKFKEIIDNNENDESIVKIYNKL
jgi:hypothetical protein